MSEPELMTETDIHAFGIEIVCKQLKKDDWNVESADVYADMASEPQIVANKDGETAFFIVRTALHPGRGRFEEGQQAFNDLVQHARDHGATCYFASVGIANADGDSDEEMATAVKGAQFHVQFDGLIKMEVPR